MRNNIWMIFLWKDWEAFWQGWIFTHWTGNLGSRKVGNLVTQSCRCDGSNASLMMDKNGLMTCHHWQPKKKEVILQIKLVYTNFNIHLHIFHMLSLNCLPKYPVMVIKTPEKHPASTMKFHLFVPILHQQKLHRQRGLYTGDRPQARLPQDAQRAEVVKLPSLLIKCSQFQDGVPVIWHWYLKS